MVIDDEVFEKIADIIKSGLMSLENSRRYYDIINDPVVSDFIVRHNAGSNHFIFLNEVLRDQDKTSCPNCGHYNDNIECPIVVCEYCGKEFKIEVPHSDAVCNECIAYKTNNCNKTPTNKQ